MDMEMKKRRFFEYEERREREAVTITVIMCFMTIWLTETIIACVLIHGLGV